MPATAVLSPAQKAWVTIRANREAAAKLKVIPILVPKGSDAANFRPEVAAKRLATLSAPPSAIKAITARAPDTGKPVPPAAPRPAANPAAPAKPVKAAKAPKTSKKDATTGATTEAIADNSIIVDGIARVDTSAFVSHHKKQPAGARTWTMIVTGQHKSGRGLQKYTFGPFEGEFTDALKKMPTIAEKEGMLKPVVRVMP